MYPRLSKYCGGFSMVELSVVLTIISITLAGALDLATRKTESDRVNETNTRLDVIEQALAVYVANNQRLPCPADASLALSNANAGVAGTALSGDCTTAFNFGAGNIYSGAVPTKALNLSDKYIADDWDRRFTYVVDSQFANSGPNSVVVTNASCASDSQCFKQALSGGITINDTTAGTAISTIAVYAIISHGKNGYGAWKYTGSATRLAASADTDEKENAGDDRTLATAGFNTIFIQKDTTTTFDDITRYATKAIIIDRAGGITDSTTCTAAYDAVTNTGSGADPCPGATSAANCYNLAAQVNKLCLQP